MSWQESDYHRHADAWLESVFEQLEDQDEGGNLDIDLQGGILTVETGDGRQFLISKHTASKEMWFSSPFSGGLHFLPADGGRDWKLADGRRLSVVLAEELSTVTGCTYAIEFFDIEDR